MLLNYICSVRSVLGKYWLSSSFASLWTEPEARSINLKNKVFIIWLYFEFPDGTAHFIGDNVCATIRRENLFLLRRFRRASAKSLGQTTKKVST